MAAIFQDGGHSRNFLAPLLYLWILLPDFDDINTIFYIFGNTEFNYEKTKVLKIIKITQNNDLTSCKQYKLYSEQLQLHMAVQLKPNL